VFIAESATQRQISGNAYAAMFSGYDVVDLVGN